MAIDRDLFYKLSSGEAKRTRIEPQEQEPEAAAAEPSTESTGPSFLDNVSEFFNPTAEQRQAMFDDVMDDAQLKEDNTQEMTGVEAWAAEKNEQTRAGFVDYVEQQAEDPNTISLARDVRQSSIYQRYLMTPEEKLKNARAISKETGLTTDAILQDETTYKNALKVHDYMKKLQDSVGAGQEFSMENVYKQFPELAGIADMDDDQMATALHDITNIREMQQIFKQNKTMLENYLDYGAFAWNRGKEQREADRAWYKVATSKDGSNRDKAEALSNKLKNNMVSAPNFFDDPLKAMIFGAGTSLPEMLYSQVEGGIGALLGGAIATTTASLYAGIIGQFGTGAFNGRGINGISSFVSDAALWGIEKGFWAGNVSMSKSMVGKEYEELSNNRDKNGKESFTHAEKQQTAQIIGNLQGIEEVLEMKAIGSVVTAATPFKGMVAEKGFKDALKNLMLHSKAQQEGVKAGFTEAAKDFASAEGLNLISMPLKTGGAELADEVAQQLTQDLGENYLKYKTGRGGRLLSPSEIMVNAADAGYQAIPGGMGFGLMGMPARTFSVTTGFTANRLNQLQQQEKYTEEARHTIVGNNLLAGMLRIVGASDLKNTDAELQRKIIRNQAAGSGFEMVYIDTDTALENENGREQLEKIAKAAGYDEDALEAAIEAGKLNVTVESFAQSEADPSILTSTSFNENEDSIAKMVKNAKDLAEQQAEIAARTEEEFSKVRDIIIKQYFPDDKDAADVTLIALYDNPDNPNDGLKNMEKQLKEARDTIIKPALDALKESIQGVEIITDDEGRGVRVSENAEWYQKFWKIHGRAPYAQEMRDIAAALTVGDSGAPVLAGWIFDEEATKAAQETKVELDNLNNELEIVARAREKMKDMTASEIKSIAGLSEEGFKVYRTLADRLQAAPGTASRAARLNAIILALHADIYADKMTKAGGVKFTALDYFNRLNISFDGEADPDAYAQLAPIEQREDIRRSYTNEDGTMKEGYMLAPNGQPTKLNEDQWLAVRTPNFKSWFGDWENDPENASKVVDENGEPSVMYHQTSGDIQIFNPRHKGAGTNDNETPFGIFVKPADNDIGLGRNQMALFVKAGNILEIKNREQMDDYLRKNVDGYAELKDKRQNMDKEMDAEYDRLDKNAEDKFSEWEEANPDAEWGERGEKFDEFWEPANNLLEEWKEKGTQLDQKMKGLVDDYFKKSEYNGVHLAEDEGANKRVVDTTIVFDPNQVKSATENNGDYSLMNDNIYMQENQNTLRLYHGADSSFNGRVIPSEGIFGGIFASDSIRSAESHGNGSIWYTDIAENDILDNHSIPYDDDAYEWAMNNVTDDAGDEVEFSIATEDDEARKHRAQVMEAHGFKPEQIENINKRIQDIAKIVEDVGKKHLEFADWQEEIVGRLENSGYPLPKISAFVENGEYKLNMDLGTLCIKREAVDAAMQLLIKEGLAQNLGPNQYWQICDVLKKHGYLVPCSVCFVESRRVRMLDTANNIALHWHAVLEALGIKDAEKIGKSDIKLTPEQLTNLKRMAIRGKKAEKKAARLAAYNELIPDQYKRGKDDNGITDSKMSWIASLMLKNHKLIGEFEPGKIMTAAGVDEITREFYGTGIDGFIAGAEGSASPKPNHARHAYDGLSWKLTYDKKRGMYSKSTYTAKRKKVFDIGGVRLQSFSDFDVMLAFDYVQFIADLEARRLPAHTYTKIPELVELFGKTGIKMNMSLLFDIVDEQDENGIKPPAGLKYLRDESGKVKRDDAGNALYEYAYAEESFDGKNNCAKAYQLRDEKGNIGTIAVALSDQHAEMLLADPRIDMVIPYHKSGLPKSILIRSGLVHADDYTDVQNTTNKPKKAKEFLYNGALQKFKDPREAAQRYVDWCKENGYTPKFEKFIKYEKDENGNDTDRIAKDCNYYKLLADFRVYDNDGKYSPQQAVRLNIGNKKEFNKKLEESIAQRVTNEKAVNEIADLKDELIKAVTKFQRIDGALAKTLTERLNASLKTGDKNEDVVMSFNKQSFFNELERVLEANGKKNAHQKVEVYRNSDQIIYGFAANGKIYLNENYINAHTPAHEFTHVWVKVVRDLKPEIWGKGKALLKEDKAAQDIYQNILKDDNYKNIHGNEDAMYSEVLSRLVGGENEKLVAAMYENIYEKKPTDTSSLSKKVLGWLQELYGAVCDIFGIDHEAMSLEQFVNAPLSAIWDPSASKEFNKNLNLWRQLHDTRFQSEELHTEENYKQEESDAAYNALVDKYQNGSEAEKQEAYTKLADMVQKAAAAAGFENAIPEQTAAYKVRTGAAPQKTVKVYKVFTLSPDGSPTALFIGGTEKLPQGVWLDAVAGYHFMDANGKYYVPSTQNPYTKGGKTGKSVVIPNDEIRQELIKRGFLPPNSKAKKVTALAYRPGWHAGTMPFFPQGGMKPPAGMKSNYENIHRYNQVVFECELAADKDYTAEAEAQPKARTKAGKLNTKNADLQYMPENGFYYYATNPMTHGHPELGMWAISGALKINRALTQEECDKILKDNNLAIQEWEQGELKLDELGYTGEQHDAARKTLAPITYDDNGNVIPLSQRFNPDVDDVRYQNEGANPKGSTSRMSDGTRLIQLMESADESTFLHEMGHLFLMDLEDLAQVDEESKKELEAIRGWAGWHKGDSKLYKGTPWAAEFAAREKRILEAESAGNTAEAEKQKRIWLHERFARGFELYLKEGKAPSSKLRSVFRKFASFLRQVYSVFTGDGARASAEVEHIMARMIATDEQIEAVAAEERFKDIEKAGGEQLLNETEKEVYQRWLNEAKEEAREKLQKIVMKDMLAQDKDEFEAMLKEEETKKRAELEQEPIYLARAIIDSMGGDKNAAIGIIYPTMEEFEAADAAAPPLEQAVQDYVAAWRKNYDEENISDKISPDKVKEAMESSAYYQKLKSLEAAAMARKLDLSHKINEKAEAALNGLEESLDNLPDQYDMQADKREGPVKELLKKINALRFSTKWNSKDFEAIDKMLKAATRDELKKQIDEFKKNMAEQKLNVKQIEEASAGRVKLYQRLAAERIGKLPIYNAICAQEYRKNQRIAERNVERMIKAGRFDIALQQKEAAAMSAAMAKEAAKIKEQVEKIIASINRMQSAKSVKLPARERYWFKKICYDIRIGQMTDPEKPVLKEGQQLGTIKSMIEGYQLRLDLAEDYDVDAIDAIIQQNTQTGYQSMTVDQLRQVENLLHIIYKCGKDEFSLKTIGGVTIEQAVEEIIKAPGLANSFHIQKQRIQDNYGGLAYSHSAAKIPIIGERLAKLGQDYLSVAMKPEKIIELLGEPAHKYIYGTFEKAANDEAEMMSKAIMDIQTMLADYSHKDRQDWKQFKYELKLTLDDNRERVENVPCSKENIICMALNLGTDRNRQRLTGGFYGRPKGVDDEIRKTKAELQTNELQRFCENNMDERDWKLVQDIWDYLHTYWADTCRVEEALNGQHLMGEEAKAFTVQMPDGKKIEMKGGYYPVKFNPDKNPMSAAQAADDVAKQMGGSQRVLGTGRSHVKSRLDADVFHELELNFDVIPAHVQQVVHNISHRLAARDVYRLLNNKELSEYIEQHLGAPYRDMLRKWAMDVWTQLPEKDEAGGKIERAFAALRRNSTFAIMAYRVWPALENLSNIGPVADELGYTNALSAVFDFYNNTKKYKKLLDKSVLMRNRINSMDRDIRSQEGLFQADNKYQEIIREHAYDLMTYSDLMFSAPLWCRAYKDNYAICYGQVVSENEKNLEKKKNAQKDIDAKRGELIDIKKDINEYYKEKRNRRNAGQIGWQPGTSRFATMGNAEFLAALPSLEQRKQELGKEIWKLEAEFGHVLDLKVYTGDELIAEAERRTVAKADAAVRGAFGSGRILDQAAVSRTTSELAKSMTTFYSFFNTQFNSLYFKYVESDRAARFVGGWDRMHAWAPFAKGVLNRIIITSLIGSLLKMATKTDGNDDRDKYRKIKKDGKTVREEIPWIERFLKVFGKNTLGMTAGAFYGIRDIANLAINFVFDGTDFGRGLNVTSTPLRPIEEGIKTIKLIANKSERDLAIREKKEKDEARLRKMSPKQRKKWEDEKKYKKPQYPITYSEIFRHGANALTGLTSTKTGISSTVVDSITGTMQYLLDTDNRYDATWRNIIWSALFDKKPVEREIPKKPENKKKRIR